jgi:two-component system response regulator VicR
VSELKKHIVCIDDDADMIELFHLILRRKGFEVSGVTGGEAGLKKIRETMPDLVLLDLMMPDMGGWEVYQQIKADEKTRNIPFIIVTAKALSIDKVLGLRVAKVDDYITKPFSPAALLKSVDQVLAKHERS